MSNFFRRANSSEVTRYSTPDGEDYISFKAELSKAEANRILSHAPRENDSLEKALTFIETFFDEAVVDWSWVDDEGNKIPPSVPMYRELESGAGRWVDDQIGTHIQKTIGRHVEKLEGESTS